MGTLIHTHDFQLANCVAQEVNRLAGMITYYYRMDRASSICNPTYGEVSDAQYFNMPNGLSMSGNSTNPEHATTTGDEGRRTQWDAQLWIARKEWEDEIRKADDLAPTDPVEPPRNGDVVNMWGKFYDVVDTTRDGIIDEDRSMFTLWKFSLTRRTKFEAWRRNEGINGP